MEESLLLPPLLIFVLEAAAFLALLLEVALSYGARIDGGF